MVQQLCGLPSWAAELLATEPDHPPEVAVKPTIEVTACASHVPNAIVDDLHSIVLMRRVCVRLGHAHRCQDAVGAQNDLRSYRRARVRVEIARLKSCTDTLCCCMGADAARCTCWQDCFGSALIILTHGMAS